MTKQAPALLMQRFAVRPEPAVSDGLSLGYDAEADAWAVFHGSRIVSHFTSHGAAAAGLAVEQRRARKEG